MSIPKSGVSVVVPVRNGARFLPCLFESLRLQDITTPWEVVVADNGSTDASHSIAHAWSEKLPIRQVVVQKPACSAIARNAGARAARTDHLVFIDADDAVSPNYVRMMRQALDSASCVTSRVDSRMLNEGWLHQVHGSAWQEERVDKMFDFLPAAGSNIAIRREVFEQLGGFDERFRVAEDIAFSWHAHLFGVEIAFVPEAVYHYRHRDSLFGLFRQAQAWGIGNALLYREFAGAGMPARGWHAAAQEWLRAAGALAGSRNRSTAAASIVRLGLCLGRLRGSVRYRVAYV